MTESQFIVKTLKVKLRSGGAITWLDRAAVETNQVWNYCAEVSAKAARPFYGRPKWLTAYDLHKLLTGCSDIMECLPAQTILKIATEYATRRRERRAVKLAWRRSSGSKRSLGWVPVRDGQLRWKDDAIVFAGRRFRVFDSYGLDGYEFRSGSFSQNALGEWFLNVAVRVPTTSQELPAKAIGVDLGLKAIATASDGQELQAGRWTREIEPKLAQLQRRGHKRQAKRLHQKAANRRRDALHKFSRKLVNECGAIYIGDVSSGKLARTRMAKSVLDSGWGMLRAMLQYKGHQAGRIVEIVNERFTTQACADCGSLTGPKGRTGLVVRGWACSECGAEHSRDINAARNILARGLSGPSAGTAEAFGPRVNHPLKRSDRTLVRAAIDASLHPKKDTP